MKSITTLGTINRWVATANRQNIIDEWRNLLAIEETPFKFGVGKLSQTPDEKLIRANKPHPVTIPEYSHSTRTWETVAEQVLADYAELWQELAKL